MPDDQKPKPQSCRCPLGRCHEEMYGANQDRLCRERQDVAIPQQLLREDDHVE